MDSKDTIDAGKISASMNRRHKVGFSDFCEQGGLDSSWPHSGDFVFRGGSGTFVRSKPRPAYPYITEVLRTKPSIPSPPKTPPRKKRKRRRKAFNHMTPEKPYQEDGDTTPDCGYSDGEIPEVKMSDRLVRDIILELDRSITNYKKMNDGRYDRRRRRVSKLRAKLVGALTSVEI